MERGEAEANPASELRGKGVRVRLLADPAAEAAQGEQSGCQEDATPTEAEKGESGDGSDLLTEDRDRAGLLRFCQPREPRVPGMGSRWTAHGGIEGGHRH